MDLLVDYGLLKDDNAGNVPLLFLVSEPPSKTGYFEAEIYTHLYTG